MFTFPSPCDLARAQLKAQIEVELRELSRRLVVLREVFPSLPAAQAANMPLVEEARERLPHLVKLLWPR